MQAQDSFIWPQFKVRTKHDNGYFTLVVMARDKASAIERTMAMENCPRRSIIEIKEIGA